ncbi:MAG: Calx-beta domain-containing protein, partial [Planctomycetota bacterium]
INYVSVPTMSIANASASESVNGVAGAIEFKVTLSAPLTEQITVNYGTTGGTAAAGVDYTSTSGTLTFIPGDIEEIVRVDLINDNLVEPNETFFVNLSSASGATIADSQGIGTILNDDGVGGAGGPNRFLAGGSPDSLSANDWMDLLEGFGRRRGQRR